MANLYIVTIDDGNQEKNYEFRSLADARVEYMRQKKKCFSVQIMHNGKIIQRWEQEQ